VHNAEIKQTTSTKLLEIAITTAAIIAAVTTINISAATPASATKTVHLL